MEKRKIKLTQNGNSTWKIELDEMDVSSFVQGISIKLDANESPRITLVLVPHDIEIPEEFQALLKVENQEDVKA